MDDVVSELRAAVASPPPTRIDVDRLIATDRRRRRVRAWTLSGTGAAVAVAALLLAPAVLRGPAAQPEGFSLAPAAPGSVPGGTAEPPCAPVTPRASGEPAPQQSYPTVRATPTETPAAAVDRLTGVLRGALRDVVPPDLTIRAALPGCTDPQFQYQPSYREYVAGGRLVRGAEEAFLHVELRPTGADEAPDCGTLVPDREHCTRTELADGGVLLASAVPYGVDGVVQLSAILVRPDGTTVRVITANAGIGPDGAPRRTAERPLLTAEQVEVLARTAGLTLYP
ncbi:hypothetical protein GA0074695_0248 [Micromonospora viridifaciens]|uniref:Uncharacterized protein n=1 Tax=Micromonospora viridifaciens TaxID=1881 RepID=A0A1C4U8C7_MICVI|nr:hypothetical protein [Micromonospora viridifaciens]SCE67869.1 hypothetical protein GA0074695_0248 [Micromonospora viridifaciens]